ncbi:hypothetical protein UPYG_G00035610 [Umbra pygmaea]|uniref:Secreted protein n=1 Tax=Umbra pygmaea TaxID=75934 RepID=A0ABD0YCS8_UMBPY
MRILASLSASIRLVSSSWSIFLTSNSNLLSSALSFSSASRRATRNLSLAASRDPADSEGDGSNFGRVKGARVSSSTPPSGRVGERPVTTSSPSTTSSATSPSFSTSSSEE